MNLMISTSNETVVNYKVADLFKYNNLGLDCFFIRGHLIFLEY